MESWKALPTLESCCVRWDMGAPNVDLAQGNPLNHLVDIAYLPTTPDLTPFSTRLHASPLSTTKRKRLLIRQALTEILFFL